MLIEENNDNSTNNVRKVDPLTFKEPFPCLLLPLGLNADIITALIKILEKEYSYLKVKAKNPNFSSTSVLLSEIYGIIRFSHSQPDKFEVLFSVYPLIQRNFELSILT
jgi:hypothetical protein